MTLDLFIPLVFSAAVGAGFVGALTGLGGGVVLIPLLVLAFGVDLRLAVGASLVAVIATSCGGSLRFLRTGGANVRVGVLLETATVAGALAGAVIAGYLPLRAIALLFVAILFWSAWQTLRPPPAPRADADTTPRDPLATRLRLHDAHAAMPGAAPTPYRVERVLPAFFVMILAGVISALVGVGGGVMKVLAMDRLMRLPFQVSTNTSTLMIGVTAAASAGVYLGRGVILPEIAGPTALGALAGSMLGARLLPRLRVLWLRRIFALVVILSGLELLRRIAEGTL